MDSAQIKEGTPAPVLRQSKEGKLTSVLKMVAAPATFLTSLRHKAAESAKTLGKPDITINISNDEAQVRREAVQHIKTLGEPADTTDVNDKAQAAEMWRDFYDELYELLQSQDRTRGINPLGGRGRSFERHPCGRWVLVKCTMMAKRYSCIDLAAFNGISFNPIYEKFCTSESESVEFAGEGVPSLIITSGGERTTFVFPQMDLGSLEEAKQRAQLCQETRWVPHLATAAVAAPRKLPEPQATLPQPNQDPTWQDTLAVACAQRPVACGPCLLMWGYLGPRKLGPRDEPLDVRDLVASFYDRYVLGDEDEWSCMSPAWCYTQIGT